MTKKQRPKVEKMPRTDREPVGDDAVISVSIPSVVDTLLGKTPEVLYPQEAEVVPLKKDEH